MTRPDLLLRLPPSLRATWKSRGNRKNRAPPAEKAQRVRTPVRSVAGSAIKAHATALSNQEWEGEGGGGERETTSTRYTRDSLSYVLRAVSARGCDVPRACVCDGRPLRRIRTTPTRRRPCPPRRPRRRRHRRRRRRCPYSWMLASHHRCRTNARADTVRGGKEWTNRFVAARMSPIESTKQAPIFRSIRRARVTRRRVSNEIARTF